MDDAAVKIKSDALRLLSFRPRSISEMRKRLKMKRYSSELIDETIDFLKLHGFLDDEKFAQLYANSRTSTRPSGRRQLAFDMERQGVPKGIVTKTMEGLTEYDEHAAARELVSLKFAKMSGVSDEKKKARLFGFLKRRGFSNGIIFDVLKQLFSEVEDLDH